MNTILNPASQEIELWDEKIARKLAVMIENLPITPNHITLLSFILTLLSGLLFATGDPVQASIAAALFMLVRFFDHLDGELARLKHCESKLGHYMDWFVDTFSYIYLFIALAIGFRSRMDPRLLVIIAGLAVTACLVNTIIGLKKEKEKDGSASPSFPVIGGFGIDDSMYLIGPVTWIGYLYPFFILSAIGSVIYIFLVLIKFLVVAEN